MAMLLSCVRQASDAGWVLQPELARREIRGE